MYFTKKCGPEFIFFNEKIFFERFGRFLTWKIDFESPIFALFDHFVKVQMARYKKNISQEWSRVKNLSCVSCAA